MLSRADRITAYRTEANIGDEIAAVIADWLESEPTSDPESDYRLYSCEKARARTFTFGYVETFSGPTYLTPCCECGKDLRGEKDIVTKGNDNYCPGCAPRHCEFCGNKLTAKDIAYDGSILDWCNSCIPW